MNRLLVILLSLIIFIAVSALVTVLLSGRGAKIDKSERMQNLRQKGIQQEIERHVLLKIASNGREVWVGEAFEKLTLDQQQGPLLAVYTFYFDRVDPANVITVFSPTGQKIGRFDMPGGLQIAYTVVVPPPAR